MTPEVFKKKLTYRAPVSLSSKDPKQFICCCEVANTPLKPGGDSPQYIAMFWFQEGYTLTAEEENFLGLKKYLNCSRNHPQQYLLKNALNATDDFPKVVYETLLWFKEHSADSNSRIVLNRGTGIIDTL